jgi:hypothetical protein
MALSFWEASLAAATQAAGKPFETVLMLGRQTSLLDEATLHTLAQNYPCSLPDELSEEKWAEPFFRALGAKEVSALDYSDYEGAQFTHDMNQPWPHSSLPAQFDVVFDGGTLEHVFNLAQGLLNAMSLVKVGGHYLAASPGDGWLGHGFHQLQPELFFRFFTAERGFILRGVWLAEFGREAPDSRLYQLHDPAVTGCRNLVPGRRPLTLLACAEKIAEVNTPPVWPGQSNYTSMWQGSESQDGPIKRSAVGQLKHTALSLMPGKVRSGIKRWLVARKHARLAKASWQQVSRVQLAPSL